MAAKERAPISKLVSPSGGHLDDALAQLGAFECSRDAENENLEYMWLQFLFAVFVIRFIHVIIASCSCGASLATCTKRSHVGIQSYALANICSRMKMERLEYMFKQTDILETKTNDLMRRRCENLNFDNVKGNTKNPMSHCLNWL